MPDWKIPNFATGIFQLTKNCIYPSTLKVEGLLRGVYKMCTKKKREKLLRDENIPPFVVPEDWEPTSEVVKKIDELLAGIPEAWRKRWWKEYQEEHFKSK